MRANVLPATQTRVAENTSEWINRQIRRQTEENIRYFAAHPYEIPHRLHELDREWDVERFLEVNMSTLALTGLALSRKREEWLILPATVLLFFMQHALQGWCPPIPIIRRLGFRTSKEIFQEKYALKAIWGDFRAVCETQGSTSEIANRAAHAAR